MQIFGTLQVWSRKLRPSLHTVSQLTLNNLQFAVLLMFHGLCTQVPWFAFPMLRCSSAIQFGIPWARSLIKCLLLLMYHVICLERRGTPLLSHSSPETLCNEHSCFLLLLLQNYLFNWGPFLIFLSSYSLEVRATISNERGPVYFLGPASAEHPQQALLSHDQWSSGTGIFLSFFFFKAIEIHVSVHFGKHSFKSVFFNTADG